MSTKTAAFGDLVVFIYKTEFIYEEIMLGKTVKVIQRIIEREFVTSGFNIRKYS